MRETGEGRHGVQDTVKERRKGLVEIKMKERYIHCDD